MCVMSAAESHVSATRALDDLYRSHVGEVYRYAYAVLGNHADAEDVTQTTFVNALRALERGERPRKPSNWLVTIAHNIVRQRFRQQQSRPQEVVLDRDVPQESFDSDGPSMEELVRALQRIPQSQREALVMRELEGRPYSEIASILDLSTSALETLLFRARRSLADELENAVTCDRAELGLSKQLDGRLSRKERKRLDDHLAECPSCARTQTSQAKQRRAFKGLALVPIPASLMLFKGVPSASAAIGIPTIGAAGTAAVVSGGVATGGAATGGGFAFGGLALGGVAVKAAAVVTAVSVASGAGYVGTKEVQDRRGPAPGTPATAVTPARAKPSPGPASAGGPERSAAAGAKGKALANGSKRATSPTGSARGTAAPGRKTPTASASSRAAKRAVRTAKPVRKPTPVRAVKPNAVARPAAAKGASAKAVASAPATKKSATAPAKSKVGATSAPIEKPARKPAAATSEQDTRGAGKKL